MKMSLILEQTACFHGWPFQSKRGQILNLSPVARGLNKVLEPLCDLCVLCG